MFADCKDVIPGTMHKTAKRLHLVWLAIAAAIAGGPVAAADESAAAGCLLAAGSGEPPTRALMLDGADSPAASLRLFCDRREIEQLTLPVPHGQTARVTLSLGGSGERELAYRLGVATAGGQSSSWLVIDAPSGIIPAGSRRPVTLTFHAHEALEVRSRHRLDLIIELGAGDKQVELSVPVELHVLEEAPLFRNRFEVDPVLGQFSQRAPRSRPALQTSAPAGGSTGE